MKIDEKTVSMTGNEFEIFSRLIETISSQEKMIRKLTEQESLAQVLRLGSNKTRPS
ncbi:MAG: hypothetical protein V8Q54_07145 [Alistipes senegalensis]